MTEEKPNKDVGKWTGLALHRGDARSEDIEISSPSKEDQESMVLLPCRT
jgi:hypothetical protein